jgi:DNA-binding transcriptional ArsR family regulator
MDALTLVAEPRRREILRLVWERERSAGEIAAALPVSFSAVSQHLARLRAAGLVEERRAGRHRYYRADRERLGPLRPLLESLWAESLDRLAAALKLDTSGERVP